MGFRRNKTVLLCHDASDTGGAADMKCPWRQAQEISRVRFRCDERHT